MKTKTLSRSDYLFLKKWAKEGLVWERGYYAGICNFAGTIEAHEFKFKLLFKRLNKI